MEMKDTGSVGHHQHTARPAQNPPGWQQAVEAWLALPWLAVADTKTLTALGIAVPEPERLSTHFNRVTWRLGLALVGSLAILGGGKWDWQTALAVSAVFASSGYNRFHFGLKGGGLAIGTAVLLGLVGLAGALGVSVPGAVSAVIILLLHWLWCAARRSRPV